MQWILPAENVGCGLGCGLWWKQGADFSPSVCECVSVLLRHLSRNRTYFPILGTEVRMEVNVFPGMFQAGAHFLWGSVGLSIQTWPALGAQKQLSGSSDSFFHPCSLVRWEVGEWIVWKGMLQLCRAFWFLFSHLSSWNLDFHAWAKPSRVGTITFMHRNEACRIVCTCLSSWSVWGLFPLQRSKVRQTFCW